PERGREAGGADCRHVHEPWTRRGRTDQVVDPPPGRTQTSVGRELARALERRPHGGGLRQDLAGGFRAHGPVVLVLQVHGCGPRHHLAVDGREHEHTLGAFRGYGQEDLVERLV